MRRLSLTISMLAAASMLSGCIHWFYKPGNPNATPDNEPTIKTLAGRTVDVQPDHGVETSEAEAIKAYQNFLAAAPKAAQRAEAMRRIGDLEMEGADGKNAQGDPDFAPAIASYQEYLKSYPNAPDNDRVLYQLSRAQEQGGDLAAATTTLNRLVKNYPDTSYKDEAQFRLGELLFAKGDYPNAQKAYATVLQSGAAGNYYDRSLYMQGWSQFKQGQLDEAVKSFFGVLDLKLPGHSGGTDLESIADLTRADRELLEDTFRVISLSLENMDGAASIATYINSPERHEYEFRVYQQLGELYLKQERIKDAADTFALFAREQPLNVEAPTMQARVVDIYEANGFATLALQAKKEYVQRYGRSSEFQKTNPEGWEKAQDLVKVHLAELARYYHASAQKSKSAADYQEAIHWYREYLTSFPTDKDAAENNFLLAELLYETNNYAEASVEYEKTAYQYPVNPRSADAGYSALLSYDKQMKAADATALPALQKSSVASALQFADKFNTDPRAAPVLANAAEKLYALKDNQQAASVAQKVIDLQPAAPDEQRRVAWTVLAYTSFEAGVYQASEQAFGQVLALTPATTANAATRTELVERQAAAIYKQGEQARNDGQLDVAVKNFERVSTVAPGSSISPNAQYDAAAALIALKDWDHAAPMLEDFRRRYPKNSLNDEVGKKLAVIYLEQGQSHNAAVELDAMASKETDSKAASELLWQAAELHDKAGSRAAAAKDYERYLTLNTQNLLPAEEARYRLANIARQDANRAHELALMKDILNADQNGGTARTDRTRYLGAVAALALAEPVADGYRKVALVEPLKKQLKLKKAKMEEALNAYATATNYGVADVSTEATFDIASIYRDFGKALMASERPARLSKVEREQYDVLLEEQAFPFEEKAIEIHEVNAQRAASGIYDKWVKQSFDALRELKPVRYGKVELSDATNTGPGQTGGLNQQGIALRQQGQFGKAAEAYQQAIKLDDRYGPALLNLGILYDLYLGDRQQAMEMYTRYLALKPDGDAQVSKWVTELKNRKPNAAPQGEKS
ncbi:tetratricopeptide (TPR) repeat protein [Oxalobacteraceae bacterium GrIS 2.11]